SSTWRASPDRGVGRRRSAATQVAVEELLDLGFEVPGDFGAAPPDEVAELLHGNQRRAGDLLMGVDRVGVADVAVETATDDERRGAYNRGAAGRRAPSSPAGVSSTR